MKKYITIILIILSFGGHSQDTVFTQRGSSLYMTTKRGTGLVLNQDLYERNFNYNQKSERRENKKLIAIDIILLTTFFVVRGLINKN